MQQLSPARGPNSQSLSQIINDICQLTKQMASTIWGRGPAVHSTPVEPAKSTLRWEKASLCTSPPERTGKQAAFARKAVSSLGAETLMESNWSGGDFSGPRGRISGGRPATLLMAVHFAYFCTGLCSCCEYPLDPIVLEQTSTWWAGDKSEG